MADTKRTLSALSTLYADNIIGAISPNDLRDGFKSIYGNYNVVTTSADLTLDDDNIVVNCDTTTQSVTLTLPGANDVDSSGDTYNGKFYIIINSNDNDVILSSSSNIAGATTYTLTKNKTILLTSVGTSWEIFADKTVIDIESQASQSTQLISGGELSINDASNGIINIGASVGHIIDASDINDIQHNDLDAVATTYTIPLVDRQNNNVSYIYYYWTGSAFALAHKSTRLTASERRDYIELGAAVHSTAGGNIEFTNDFPLWGVSVKSQVDDLMEAIKAFNLSGNAISAASNDLTIAKSAGFIFKRAVSPNTKAPNEKSLGVLNSATNLFRYRLQDGTEFTTTSAIDPDNYDNNGTLDTVPQNDWSIQRLGIFSSNQIRIQYGQSTYNTKTAAIDGIFTESFTYEPNISENGVILAYVIVKQGATDLSDNTQAAFYQAGKFGGAFASGSGLVDLQEAYNNSTDPEIITSNGALTLKNGGSLDTDNVFEVQNLAGTETFSVLANGVVQLKSTTHASAVAGQLWNDGVKIISDGALKSNDTIGVGGSKTDSSISNWETSRFKPFVSESFGIFGDNVGAGGGFVTNAYWNGTGWQAPDSGKCQYALFSGGSGDYIMYGFEASAPFESITWSERFRIGAGGVLSLASTTNASPTAGQLWNDGTRLNIYGELLIDGGTNTNFRVGSNLSNLGGEPAFRVLTTDFATYIDARADSTGDGITFRCGNQTEQGFAREYMKVDPSTGNVNFKQVLNVEATANVSPSLADIWNESTRLNVRGDFHVNGDTLSVNGSGLTNNSRLLLGDETSDATDNQTGYRVLARSSEGDIFVDHKTKLTKVIKYRCGEGAEQGFTHTFMEVDPTDGSVTFPNSSFGVIDVDFGKKFAYNANDVMFRGLNDTGTSRWTTRKACTLASISYNWGTAPTSAYKFQYSINGGTWTDFNTSTIAANDQDGYQDSGSTISLSAGDYIEIRCDQSGTSPSLLAYFEE